MRNVTFTKQAKQVLYLMLFLLQTRTAQLATKRATSSLLLSRTHRNCFWQLHLHSSSVSDPLLPTATNTNMNFGKIVLSSLLLSTQATAWTTTPVSRQALGIRASRRYLSATQLHSTASTVSSLETEVHGEEQTESFRLKFKDSGSVVSPWHDIPLKNDDGSYNMVNNIPGGGVVVDGQRRCEGSFLFFLRGGQGKQHRMPYSTSGLIQNLVFDLASSFYFFLPCC